MSLLRCIYSCSVLIGFQFALWVCFFFFVAQTQDRQFTLPQKDSEVAAVRQTNIYNFFQSMIIEKVVVVVTAIGMLFWVIPGRTPQTPNGVIWKDVHWYLTRFNISISMTICEQIDNCSLAALPRTLPGAFFQRCQIVWKIARGWQRWKNCGIEAS